MSKSAIVLAALVLVGETAVGPSFADEATVPALRAEAEGLVKNYAAQLRAALGGAIEASGPLGALSVCRDQAPIIAAALSRESGWSIARTSLKPRNAASAPDDYERKVMQDFDARVANGEKAADLVSAEIVEDHGETVFRFVKAIPTAANCLTCHGGDVKPEVKAKIAELYPDDRATGFKLGDMRGAFTLQKRLDAASH